MKYTNHLGYESKNSHNRNKKSSFRRIILSIILTAVMLVAGLFSDSIYAAITAPTNLKTHAAYAVIDADTGEILLEENCHKSIYPASTTKLMSAIVILEKCQTDGISLSSVVTVKQSVLNKVESDLTSYGLTAGKSYTLLTLMNMMLVSSYGDATYCAADYVFGSLDACVTAMNDKASELGLENTCFDNVAGLDIGNGYNNIHSTALDIAKISRYAVQNSTIASIVKKSSYVVKTAAGTTERTITNTNRLITYSSYQTSLYTVTGIKTGTTNAAGYVLSSMAVDTAGHRVICVYIGKYNTAARYDDSKEILDTVFTALNQADTEDATETNATYEITASSLNVRSGPGTSYSKLGYVTAGQTFTVTAISSNNWGKINYNGQEGWISLKYCSEITTAEPGTENQSESTSEAADSSESTSEAADSSESTEASSDTETPQTTETPSAETQTTESQTTETPSTETQTTETQDASETASTGKQYKVTASSLNVRSGAGTSYSKLGALTCGSVVTVTEISSNNWGKINYNGKTGWISLNYCTLVSGSTSQTTDSSSAVTHTYTVTASSLNVRTGPGTSYSLLGYVTSGTKVSVTEVSSNNWGKISYKGKTGWISLKYCKKVS